MSDQHRLQAEIERHFAAGAAAIHDPAAMDAFTQLRTELNSGRVRSAEPDPAAPFGWRVGQLTALGNHDLSFVDKGTFPARTFTPEEGIRIVVGGSSVREGAYLARGVICVPPMYVNVGAYVDEGTLVDSHALVGSCAQIGKRVHLSAAAQIGGVLEPVNANPVIIEDDVLVGGNCGVYEGTIVRERAVLAAGTILTRGTPVYDIVNGVIHKAEAAGPGADPAAEPRPLVIPAGAVVVPGSRAITRGRAAEWGLSLYAPVIVKYRDDKTDLSAALEDLLR